MKTPQWYAGSKTFRYASNSGTFIMIRNRMQLCCQFFGPQKNQTNHSEPAWISIMGGLRDPDPHGRRDIGSWRQKKENGI